MASRGPSGASAPRFGNSPGGRIARRTVLRGALPAAVVAAAGTGGFALAASRPARLRAASGKIQLWYSVGGYGGTTPAGLAGVQQLLQDGFVATHRGIDLKVNEAFGWNASGLAAAMVAGTAPDVFEEFESLPTFAKQGLFLDISPYVQRDNLNLADFLPGQLHAYKALNSSGVPGLYALPAYVHQTAMMVNLGALDELGIEYPSETWDYSEAERLWRSVAGTTPQGKRRYGGNFIWQPDGPNSFYMRGWGASYVDPADPTRCVMDSPAGIACAEWLFGLIADQVCTNNYSPYNGGGQHFKEGRLITQWTGSDGEMVPMASGLGGVKWRFYPTPAWPRGKYTKVADDFHAIWSGTRYPDAAWELLRFLSTDKNWQRGLIKLFLTAPALNSLWPDYVRAVEEFAPPLRGKNLEVFVTQVEEHMPSFRSYFAYESDTAFSLIDAWTTKVLNRQVSVVEGYRQAATQVNAFEAAQKAAAGHALRVPQIRAQLAAALQAGTEVAAPSRTGAGNAPTAAPKGAVAPGPGGLYTLVGDGADVWSPTANCVFAGAIVRAASGTFTCRVTLLANVDCPHLSQWSKVGLMACGDLSDNAAAITIDVTGGNGVTQQTQWAPSAGWGSAGPTTATAAQGLLGARVITRPNTAPAPNYLLRPVWLRLVRNGMVWTTFTSLDGKRWTQAGAAQGLEAEGVWVGLFATAHNDSFGGKGTIRAGFDSVSGFQPSTFVQVGAATA